MPYSSWTILRWRRTRATRVHLSVILWQGFPFGAVKAKWGVSKVWWARGNILTLKKRKLNFVVLWDQGWESYSKNLLSGIFIKNESDGSYTWHKRECNKLVQIFLKVWNFLERLEWCCLVGDKPVILPRLRGLACGWDDSLLLILTITLSFIRWSGVSHLQRRPLMRRSVRLTSCVHKFLPRPRSRNRQTSQSRKSLCCLPSLLMDVSKRVFFLFYNRDSRAGTSNSLPLSPTADGNGQKWRRPTRHRNDGATVERTLFWSKNSGLALFGCSKKGARSTHGRVFSFKSLLPRIARLNFQMQK